MSTETETTLVQGPAKANPCQCGAHYTWSDPRGVAIHMNELHVYVACGRCGREGRPVVHLPLEPRGAIRDAINHWNEANPIR